MSTRMLYVSMKNRNVEFRPHNGPKDPNQTIFKVYVKDGEIGTISLPHQVFDNAVFIVDAESHNVLVNRGRLIRDDADQPISVVDMQPLPKCSDLNFERIVEVQGRQNEDFAISMDALVAEIVQD